MANDIKALVSYIREFESMDAILVGYGSVCEYLRLNFGCSREVGQIVQDRLSS